MQIRIIIRFTLRMRLDGCTKYFEGEYGCCVVKSDTKISTKD